MGINRSIVTPLQRQVRDNGLLGTFKELREIINLDLMDYMEDNITGLVSARNSLLEIIHNDVSQEISLLEAFARRNEDSRL